MCPIGGGFVMLRRTAVVAVLVVVVLSWRTASTEPCTKGPTVITCQFSNTTQDIVVGSGSVAAGVASEHPVISCPPTLDVSNDSSTSPKMGKSASSDQPHPRQPSLNRTMAYVTTASTSSNESMSAQPRNTTRTMLQPQQDCAVRVFVQDSAVQLVQGHFEAAIFHDSEIGKLDGVYMKLKLKNTVVSNISVSVRNMKMEDTRIKIVSQLMAKQSLQLNRAELGTVAPNGLHLLPPGLDEPDSVHTLRDVVVQRMEADSLMVIGAKVSIINMTVNWMVRDAVTVRTHGTLNLTDVVLQCDLYYCLNLEKGARLVLRNVTIGNKTITKLDLRATSEANMYPLFALVSKDDSRNPFAITFPWYWLVAMTACGIVAGMVIGSALMWKRPAKRHVPAVSTFTLSDLLSHDRLQENNEEARRDQTMDTLRQPTLTRQDSGLTSSSFASYMPFQTSRTDAEGGTSSIYNNAVSDDV